MKVCLVGSSGGHLTHLYMLKPFWQDQDRFWVTFPKPDAQSLLAALQLGKVPVVVPRMHSFQEHVNDHQLLFCRQVAQRCNNIILVEDAAWLGEILKNYDALAAQRFGQLQSNTAAFNERIQQIAEELVLKK